MKNGILGDFFRYIFLFFTGKIKTKGLPNPKLTEPLSEGRIFRYARIVPRPTEDPPVALRVTFQVKKVDFFQKVILPKVSQIFYMGAPGFREKCFFIDEKNKIFQGFYLWNSVKDIENYKNCIFRRKLYTHSGVNFTPVPIEILH